MTEYKITTDGRGAVYVINDMGASMGGPYKNEESAKRRIRDLKRKEAEAVGAKIDNGSDVAVIADDFRLDYPTTGLLTVNEHDHVVQNPDTLDDDMRKFVAENVAMSSAYGKIGNNEKPLGQTDHSFGNYAPINRQVGVYPAIPKRAYQRNAIRLDGAKPYAASLPIHSTRPTAKLRAMVYTARKTSRGDKTVNGVLFESWQTGISQFRLISTDNRCIVGRNYNRSTYFASVDMKHIGDRYHTETGAMQAAIKKAYKDA